MITLETTARCPLGMTAALALDRLGKAYELRIVEEGHFLARYGAPGPRVIEQDRAHLGRDAVGPLLDRVVEGASAAGLAVHHHLRDRVAGAILRFVRATSADARGALLTELASLQALVWVVPETDYDLLAPALTPIRRFFEVVPELHTELPVLARRIEAMVGGESFRRVSARIAAAAIASPEEVLDFWFGAPIANAVEALERAQRWFRGGDAMDAEVRARFLPTIEAALRGDLDAWANTTRGRLALVIVLDQLTRNAFRGDPRTWSGDERARALTLEALDRGLDEELGWIERMFLGMPLLHAEDPAAQDRSLSRARAAQKDPPPALARLAEAHLEQAEKYQAIIARFGRFPFRNAVLGRQTSDEERAFLEEFARIGPPRMMRA